MKVDLKLLSMRFSQMKDEPPVPTEGVNSYLLEKILLPCMNGGRILLQNIDFDSFEVEDVDELEEYYDELSRAGMKLQQFMETVQNLPSESCKTRSFC